MSGRDVAEVRPAVELFNLGDSVSARRALGALAADMLSEERLGEFEVALTEIVTNAIVHGRGQVDVRMWRMPESVVIEVHDEGEGPQDTTGVGVTPPDRSTTGGFGVWIARNWSDDLRFDTRAGCTVRLTAQR